MYDKARELAQEMVDSGEKSYRAVFTIDDTDEAIVVMVARVKKSRTTAAKRLEEFVAGPAGSVCPCCRGTGRA